MGTRGPFAVDRVVDRRVNGGAGRRVRRASARPAGGLKGRALRVAASLTAVRGIDRVASIVAGPVARAGREARSPAIAAPTAAPIAASMGVRAAVSVVHRRDLRAATGRREHGVKCAKTARPVHSS
jgi:hypothetical protein